MSRLLLAALLLAALAPAAEADVTTFGYGNARAGWTPGHGLTSASAGRLRPAWSTDVGAAINTEPLVARGLVVVGEEHGAVVALDARTGRPVWRRRLATRKLDPVCQASPDSRFGVTSTPVIDRSAGRVYVVDVAGRLFALSLTDGHVLPGWPVAVQSRPGDFVWSALTLSRGHVYVMLSSLCDQAVYDGGVAAVDTATRSVQRWSSTAGTGGYAGGIWGWGGASVDTAGSLFVATGNTLGSAHEDDGHGEQVVRLDPALNVMSADDPLVGPFAADDRDFGSTPVLIDAAGCPPQLVALNKTGQAFLYDRDRLASGPVQTLRVAAPAGVPLIGLAAYDPGARTLALVSPQTPQNSRLRAGLQAFRLTGRCRLALRWQHALPYPLSSALTIGGDVIYLGTSARGDVRGFRVRDGRMVFSHYLSAAGVVAAPTVSADRLYAADWSGRVWAFALPRR